MGSEQRRCEALSRSTTTLCRDGDEELLLRGAALLRIAEQLERNRDQVVSAARLRRGPDDGIELELDTIGDDTVARWGAERQGDLFERAFGAPLTVVRGERSGRTRAPLNRSDRDPRRMPKLE